MWPSSFRLHTFSHLTDTFIQSDLQVRDTAKASVQLVTLHLSDYTLSCHSSIPPRHWMTPGHSHPSRCPEQNQNNKLLKIPPPQKNIPQVKREWETWYLWVSLWACSLLSLFTREVNEIHSVTAAVCSFCSGRLIIWIILGVEGHRKEGLSNGAKICNEIGVSRKVQIVIVM